MWISIQNMVFLFMDFKYNENKVTKLCEYPFNIVFFHFSCIFQHNENVIHKNIRHPKTFFEQVIIARIKIIDALTIGQMLSNFNEIDRWFVASFHLFMYILCGGNKLVINQISWWFRDMAVFQFVHVTYNENVIIKLCEYPFKIVSILCSCTWMLWKHSKMGEYPFKIWFFSLSVPNIPKIY